MSGRKRRTKRRAELSQHFLLAAPAASLVQATSVSSSDLVVEIGPGRGALTKPLLKRAGRVIGVELDKYLATRLAEDLVKADIVHADFLDFPLPQGDYSVVGNVPYSRTTEIIAKLVTAPNPPRDAWLVVQRELAQRMCGPPYGNETLWSLRLKPGWHVEVLARPRKTDFSPPPSVESAFLHLSHRARPLISVAQQGAFESLIRVAYEHRGSISSALRSTLSKTQIRRLGTDLHFQPDSPSGSLSFEQWLGIFRWIQQQNA